MRIDVALNPAEVALLSHRDLSQTTCVVFDVLRATSSMITALAHGVREIYPVLSIDEARTLRGELGEAIMGGERDGEIIDGFDVGNSPFEYRELAERKVITTTTNGTVALRACEGAEMVLVGALLNLDQLAEEIRWKEPEEMLLVCAGTFADFALEDVCAAGLLTAAFPEATLSDAARAAFSIARHFPTPLDALLASTNGRVLAGKGRGKEVEWCAQVSRFNVVGIMEQAVIRPIEA